MVDYIVWIAVDIVNIDQVELNLVTLSVWDTTYLRL